MGFHENLLRKIKMTLGLSLVFVLILATNVVDNDSFEIVKKSVTTIYEDRLVSKNMLYKILNQLNDKKIKFALAGQTSGLTDNSSNKETIEELINQYSATKLTREEAKYFNQLKENITELERFEQKYYADVNAESGVRKELYNQFQKISINLDILLDIQLKEGEKQLASSLRAVNSSNMIANVEIVFLVIIGLIIQLFIFYNPNKSNA